MSHAAEDPIRGAACTAQEFPEPVKLMRGVALAPRVPSAALLV